mmetsp:Transcript_17898/g.54782  ORF Transcript_17898/g.54782 Transcript_17898/m.54782 type:complete len:928 (-) Transcript_17898:124-2907(-)
MAGGRCRAGLSLLLLLAAAAPRRALRRRPGASVVGVAALGPLRHYHNRHYPNNYHHHRHGAGFRGDAGVTPGFTWVRASRLDAEGLWPVANDAAMDAAMDAAVDAAAASTATAAGDAGPPDEKMAMSVLLGALRDAGAEDQELAGLAAAVGAARWRELSASREALEGLANRAGWLAGLGGGGEVAALLSSCPELLTSKQYAGSLGALLGVGLTLADVIALLSGAPGQALAWGADKHAQDVITFLTAPLPSAGGGSGGEGADAAEDMPISAASVLDAVTAVPAGVLDGGVDLRANKNGVEATAKQSAAPTVDVGLGLRRQDARRLLRSAPRLLADVMEVATESKSNATAQAEQERAAGTIDLMVEVPSPRRKRRGRGGGARGRGDAAVAEATTPADAQDLAFRAFLQAQDEKREREQRRRRADELLLEGAKRPDGQPVLPWHETPPRERLQRSVLTLSALGLGPKFIRQDARKPQRQNGIGAVLGPEVPDDLVAPMIPALLQTPTTTLFRFAALLARKEVNIAPHNLGAILKKAPGLPQQALRPANPDAIAKAIYCADLVFAAQKMLAEQMEAAEERGEPVHEESGVGFLKRSLGERDAAGVELGNEDAATMEAPLEFLVELGIDEIGGGAESGIAKILRAEPAIAVADVATQLAPVCMFLSVDLGLDIENMTKAVVAFPALLLMNVESQLEPLGRIICSLAKVKYGSPGAGRIFRAFPSILTLDISKDIAPTVLLLKEALRCSDDEFSRVVRSLPSLLGYDRETNLWPKLEFLFGYCRLDTQFLTNDFPAALSYPLLSVLEPRFEFLAAAYMLGQGSGGYNAALAATPSESFTTKQLWQPKTASGEDSSEESYIMNHIVRKLGGLGPILTRSDEDFAKIAAQVPPHVYVEFKKQYTERRNMVIRTRGYMDAHLYNVGRKENIIKGRK